MKKLRAILLLLVLCLCEYFNTNCLSILAAPINNEVSVDGIIYSIPSDWQNSEDAYLNLNTKPDFSNIDIGKSFELYGELDSLGRCTQCVANIGLDLMPTEERGAIGQIKPTGWQTIKYDNIDGKYLYNRCHLIGYQLTGENANERNLITGTRYLNVVGMLPFENKVADYIKNTGSHVLYRVTPIFTDDELVARYVHLEALDIEDNGQYININILLYNKQPGIIINYADGTSSKAGENIENEFTQPEAQAYYYINENTKKFHKESCRYVNDKMKRVHKSKKQLTKQGYDPCKVCNP